MKLLIPSSDAKIIKVKVPSHKPDLGDLGDNDDWEICYLATSRDKPLKWDEKFRKYSDEAKRRNLTITDCKKHLDIKTATTPAVKTPQPQGSGSIEERLAKLKELLDKGLLTPDEASAKRKEILKGL